MRRALSSLLLLSLMGTARAGQRMEPAALRLGEVARYLVETPELASVEALAATTVHPPAGEGLQVTHGRLRYRYQDGRYSREDVFWLRPTQAGEVIVKPAVVEGPGGVPERAESRTLVVRPRLPAPARSPLALAGGTLLVLGLGLGLLWRRRRAGGRAEEHPAGPSRVLEDPLQAVRQARIRGDVRDFHVALYAALRAAVRAVAGKSPRDPKGLGRAGQDAGLSRAEADQLRNLATQCERVVFGGEEVDAGGLGECYQRAEGLMASLRALDSEEETQP